MNPKGNRQKLVTEMFEKYQFKGVMVAVQAVLTLYAQGTGRSQFHYYILSHSESIRANTVALTISLSIISLSPCRSCDRSGAGQR